jgi:hypothetical protein
MLIRCTLLPFLQIGGATFCLNYIKDNMSSQERQDGRRDAAAL